MYSQDGVLRLTALIYEAALDPQRWPRFLDQLAVTLDGHTVTLWSVTSSGVNGILAMSRVDPAFLTAYHRGYAELDPWVLEGRKRNLFRPGVVKLGEEVVAPRELLRTEFFNDLGRKFEFFGGLATVFGPNGSCGCVSVVQRRFSQFGEAELALLQALTPHIERGLAISSRLGALETLQRATEDVLDRLSVAAIVVDRLARPLIVNAAARKIIGSGLQSTKAGLVAGHPSETRALRQLVTACARTQAGDGLHPGATLIVSRPLPKPHLHVTVMPIRRVPGTDDRIARPAALIIVRDPSLRCDIPSSLLRDLYRLTPAEIRVATLLAGGQTVTQIAATLGVTVHTVRTHLKRTFGKTQTRTQGQLVRVLLAGSPAAGS